MCTLRKSLKSQATLWYGRRGNGSGGLLTFPTTFEQKRHEVEKQTENGRKVGEIGELCRHIYSFFISPGKQMCECNLLRAYTAMLISSTGDMSFISYVVSTLLRRCHPAAAQLTNHKKRKIWRPSRHCDSFTLQRSWLKCMCASGTAMWHPTVLFSNSGDHSLDDLLSQVLLLLRDEA